MKRYVRSATLTNYAEVARTAGLDPRRLMRESGLPPGCLRERELKLPAEAVRRLLEVSAECSGVEAFGLLMAETRRLSNLGPLGLLMREQSTVRLALETLARYANRLNEVLFLAIEDAGEVVVLRAELVFGGSGSVRQATELAVAVAFGALQESLGSSWKPRRVCFAHAAPADRSVHHRIFGPIVVFGSDFNGIVLGSRDIEVVNPKADSAMGRYAEGLVEASWPHRAQDMTSRVRQLIATMLGTENCTIDVAARHLGTSRRTVHRRLAMEGRTFSAIVDDVRREFAVRHVTEKRRTLAEISALLGFSAPSSFSRWFRRHFKQAASQVRPRSLRPLRPRR